MLQAHGQNGNVVKTHPLLINEEFGEIIGVEIEGKPYVVANDVAKALGYTNPRKAVKDHCKGVTKRYILTNGGQQLVSVMPEGDIYRLIVRSKLPSAQKYLDMHSMYIRKLHNLI